MGRRSREMASRRRTKKAIALAAGDSGLSPVFRCLRCTVSPCLPADKLEQAEAASEGDKILTEAAASEEGKIPPHVSDEDEEGDKILVETAASEEGKILPYASDEDEEGDKILVEAASEEVKILKHESEEDEEGDKMLKLDSLVLEPEERLEDRQGRVLMLDSEEDCKILMKVKSEEGKILKLRKEYAAATEVALAAVSHIIAPTLKPAEPEPAGKKKKMKVVKTLVPPAHIALIKAMPCPVTTPEFYVPDSYYKSEEDLNISRTFKLINIKMRDYHQALVDQYDKFGFAVDEAELTDDEDEDNMVKN